MKIFSLCALYAGLFLCAGGVFAQEVHQDLKEIVTADIQEILSEEEREILGTNSIVHVQHIEAILTSGTQSGKTVIFENELTKLEKGDTVYMYYVKTIDGVEYYVFKDFKRHTELIILSLFSVGLLVFFSEWQGVRALISLAVSIGAIIFILVPLMLEGYNPILVSLGVATIVLASVLFLTHGFTAQTTIAFFGTFAAVLCTCLIAWISVTTMRLNGFGSDASVALNFSTRGTLDFGGLLLGSIIIGILGMLDDVSVTQASVVRQLKFANKTLTSFELYKRSIIVGKDHLGSLVNTLALAYEGISLPLILLFAHADSTLGITLNQEVVASELVRIIVGSIGLILAVPLTTLIASWYFGIHEVGEDSTHTHGHGHTH